MSNLLLANTPDANTMESVLEFCTEFCRSASRPKFIFGRNIYAASVAKQVSVVGFIDEYADVSTHLGRPIVALSDVPKDALVLSVSGGRPFSAKRRLDGVGLRNLDYFAFYRYSGLALTPMRFNEGFEEEFRANEAQYSWIYGLLRDEESKRIFRRLVSFRYYYNLEHLDGFTWKEDVQYFEPFLSLKGIGETFIDVGGFDGYTSAEFMKRYPGYRAVHVFEPDPGNFEKCVSRVGLNRDVVCHPFGLSRGHALLKLEVQGSGSRVSERGSIEVTVDALDEVLHDVPTFIKMDVEGAEMDAIEGARETIFAHHPTLAISVYHKPGDFWRIPRLVFSIRDDYEVFIRHYTECIYETVMFFVPIRN